MRAILIPVKELNSAKQRLAAIFTPAERSRLTWAMLEHVFQQVSRAQGVARIFVVTTYGPAARLASGLGMEVIRETLQMSESQSVDWASQLCRERGATTLLRLPIDLPLLRAQDIETILARTAPAPSAVLVPSRDGRGTNAISRTPPDLFPSHFGPNSLAKHQQEVLRAGAKSELLNLPSVALDIDDPSDLACFLAQGREGKLLELLGELDAASRLRAFSQQQSAADSLQA